MIFPIDQCIQFHSEVVNIIIIDCQCLIIWSHFLQFIYFLCVYITKLK